MVDTAEILAISLLALDELVEQYEQRGDVAGMEGAMVARSALRMLHERDER